jgi:4-amino-4-deoxy-L-arabinose transferase-like glycosyltransferase
MPPVVDRDRIPLLSVLFAIAALVLSIAPTLSSVEFGRTLENLNVATALEARRDGHWLVPTLETMPRTKKPPLMAWTTALAMSPQTVRNCSNPDPAIRAAAFRQLAFQSRWPALLMSALTMLVVYHLGRICATPQVGAAAALIFGSAYLVLRYAQVAVTDVPLMLWVTTANTLIAVALFTQKRWTGCLGAGVAIGLAFLSKGPVAFVQTIAPLVVFLFIRRFAATRSGALPARGRLPLAPILAGLLAFLAVGVPWYLAVLLRDPQRQWSTWFREVTGSDAPDRGEPFPTYGLYFLIMLFPWVIFLLGGAWTSLREAAGRHEPSTRLPEFAERFVYVLCLVLVPLLVMSFFKDKKERYALPVAGPAAVLAARCFIAYLAERPRDAKRDWVGWLHWIMLAVITIGLPLAGAMGSIKVLRTLEGTPWYSHSYAIGAVAIGGALCCAGLAVHLRHRPGTLTIMFLIMLLVNAVFMHGYVQTASGRSDMRPLAERIWATYPDAQTFTSLPRYQRASVDLSIYLNRPTGWITEAEMTQPPGPRPQVVLAKQREHEPPPQPPPGWKVLMSFPKGDGGTWHVFARRGGGGGGGGGDGASSR